MLVRAIVLCLWIATGSIVIADQDAVYLDYTSVTGGPALAVHEAMQGEDGSWYVHGNDRRIWKWQNGSWEMLIDHPNMLSRPEIVGLISETEETTYFVGNGNELFSAKKNGQALPVPNGVLEQQVIDVFPYSGGAVILSTTGVLSRTNERGQDAELLLACEFQPVYMQRSGDVVLIVGGNSQGVLFDLASETELFRGNFQHNNNRNVVLVGQSVYVLNNNVVEVHSPPFFDVVETIEVPITGSTVSVNNSDWIIVASDREIATSTNAGLNWNITSYADWEIKGCVAGADEFCVYGVLGEVHFSKNGVDWENNFLRIKREARGIVAGHYLDYVYTDSELFELKERTEFGPITKVAELGVNTIRAVSVPENESPHFAFVAGDSTVILVGDKIVKRKFEFPVFAIAREGYSNSRYYVVSDQSIYEFEDWDMVREIPLPVGAVANEHCRIQTAYWDGAIVVLFEQSLWKLPNNQSEWELLYQSSVPWDHVSFEANAKSVLFGDTIVFEEYQDWYKLGGNENVLGLSGVYWWGLTDPCKFSESSAQIYGHYFKELDYMPLRVVGQTNGILEDASTLLCDSATVGRIVWNLPPQSVEPLESPSTLKVSLDTEPAASVTFTIDSEQTLGRVAWSLNNLSGQKVATGETNAQSNTAHITINRGFPPGLYILVVESAGAGVGTFKVLLE